MWFKKKSQKICFSSIRPGEPFFFRRNGKMHLGMATEEVCWEEVCGKQSGINAIDLISGDCLWIISTEMVEKAKVKIMEA